MTKTQWIKPAKEWKESLEKKGHHVSADEVFDFFIMKAGLYATYYFGWKRTREQSRLLNYLRKQSVKL